MKLNNKLTGKVLKVNKITKEAFYLEDNSIIPMKVFFSTDNIEIINEEGDDELYRQLEEIMKNSMKAQVEKDISELGSIIESVNNKALFIDAAMKFTASMLTGNGVAAALSKGAVPINIGSAMNIGFKAAKVFTEQVEQAIKEANENNVNND